MSTNSGIIIKKLAILYLCLMMIISIVLFFVFLDINSVLAFLVALALIIVSAISTLFLYAFGQLVSDTYTTKMLTYISLECQINSLENEDDKAKFYKTIDNLQDRKTLDL